MARELSRRLFLKKASLAPALMIVPDASEVRGESGKRPVFDNALDELQYICRNTSGCTPQDISYELMKRSVDEGAGTLLKSRKLGSLYRHTLSSQKLGFQFYCYTDQNVNKKGEFVS